MPEYNIFMFLYDNYISNNANILLTFNKNEIIQKFKTIKENKKYKINYNYYKFFTLETIKYLYSVFFNEANIKNSELLKIYIPKYKLLLLKDEYINYGVHRFGWSKTISNFLQANYTETDAFHLNNPYFEWVQYGLIYNLSSYAAAVEHFNLNILNVDCNLFKINNILFDDWLEKTYLWRSHKCYSYKSCFISFKHDPPINNLTDSNNYCKTMVEKLQFEDICQNEKYLKDAKNLKLLITLSNNHKQYLENNTLINDNIKFLYHPMEFDNSFTETFNYSKYNSNKSVYFIGWWLRKYDIFLKLHTINQQKIILLKSKEGMHVSDYVIYEIKKHMLEITNLSNSVYQEKFTDEEYKILKNNYNIQILHFLQNKEYDTIFQKSIIFLDFYNTSANNIILECILFNTPILVNLNEAVVDYLGVDYPFYFSTLEQANAKINDTELVYKTHLYLKNMDKTKFTYNYFNEQLSKLICDLF